MDIGQEKPIEIVEIVSIGIEVLLSMIVAIASFALIRFDFITPIVPRILTQGFVVYGTVATLLELLLIDPFLSWYMKKYKNKVFEKNGMNHYIRRAALIFVLVFIACQF